MGLLDSGKWSPRLARLTIHTWRISFPQNGCVAAFKGRQEHDWSSPSFVSCRHFEQLVDALNLSPNIRTCRAGCPKRLSSATTTHPPVAVKHRACDTRATRARRLVRGKRRWTVRATRRRCCTNRQWPARGQSTGSSPADAIRHWSAEGGHPIEDLTAENGLTPLPSWTPGAKAIADDGLVAEERILHPALTMVP